MYFCEFISMITCQLCKVSRLGYMGENYTRVCNCLTFMLTSLIPNKISRDVDMDYGAKLYKCLAFTMYTCSFLLPSQAPDVAYYIPNFITEEEGKYLWNQVG